MDLQRPSFPTNIAPATTVASFLPLTFLQNIFVEENGDVLMNSVMDGRVWRYQLRDGKTHTVGQVPGQANAVAPAPDEGLVVIGRAMDSVVTVFHMHESGKVDVLMSMPDAGWPPNGLEPMGNGLFIFADSEFGLLWELNYWKRSYRIFFQHEELSMIPGSWMPGPNGFRIFKNRLYISVTSRLQFVSVELRDGEALAETLKVLKNNILADDFDIDTEGNIYTCTHPWDVVLRLTPTGELAVIAGAEEGVRGNTACRFGRGPGDEKSLYVVTDGGLMNPGAVGVKRSALVRLTLDKKGGSLIFQNVKT